MSVEESTGWSQAHFNKHNAHCIYTYDKEIRKITFQGAEYYAQIDISISRECMTILT